MSSRWDNPSDYLTIGYKALVVGEYKIDGRNNTYHFDITIPQHNFGMSWNLGNSTTWAIDGESVKEVGCIHTCRHRSIDKRLEEGKQTKPTSGLRISR